MAMPNPTGRTRIDQAGPSWLDVAGSRSHSSMAGDIAAPPRHQIRYVPSEYPPAECRVRIRDGTSQIKNIASSQTSRSVMAKRRVL